MVAKVVDASALAAVLFGEPAGEEVARRLDQGVLVAPTLLRYEIGSVCRKKMRRHPRKRDDLITCLGLIHSLEIEEVEIPILESVELAAREDLTVYDAAYLWLARSLRAELVTLDSRLEAAVGR